MNLSTDWVPWRKIWLGIFVMIIIMVVLSNMANTTGAVRAALCPAGTVYITQYDACMAGSRPWESAPVQ